MAFALAPLNLSQLSATAHCVEVRMSSFGIYLIGFIIVIVGLAFAASLLGVSTTWIAIGVVVLIGLAILSGVSRTKRPDPPAT